MVAVRKNSEILTKATGKLLLFDEPVGRYRYSLYVTNLDLPAEQIWLSYKDRADAENRIKELKYDFGLDSFCMDKFWATEAAFRTIMMAYNLMSLFRQIVLQSKSIMIVRKAASVAQNLSIQKLSNPKSYFSSLMRFSASARSL